MRNLRTISQEKKIALVCKIATIVFFIGYSIFFTILFHRYYTCTSRDMYWSDLLLHLGFARKGMNLYSLTYLLLGLVDKLPHAGWLTSGMLTAFLLLGVVASKLLLQQIMPKVNKWIVWVLAWIANMFFTFNISYFPGVGELDYRGMLNFNVYHNPTYIMMKPFALLTLWFFFRLINKYADEGIKVYEWFVLSGLMLLTTWFKPNFMIGFSLSLLCLLIFDFIRHRGKKILNYIALGTTVFPSVALMYFQQTVLFSGGNSNSQMKLGFMTGLRAMAHHPEIKIFLSLIFPLVILCFVFKDLIKDRFYAFGWFHMIVNLGITVFVYETGYRLHHGNFIWSSFFALGVLFIVSLAKLVKLAQEKRVGALALSSGALGAHVFCWINYVCDLMSGTMGF